ncbi:unknown [Ruminococcus sp. CAG:624]|nr:unknown [Ruminococcus sp. CAG:624]
MLSNANGTFSEESLLNSVLSEAMLLYFVISPLLAITVIYLDFSLTSGIKFLSYIRPSPTLTLTVYFP